MPAFLLGDWAKTAAASLSNLASSLPQTPGANPAPLAPLTFSTADNYSAKFASTVLTVNTTLANGFVSAIGFFKTAQLPEGFDAAQPISPATTFLFSLGDSVGSFLGFFSTINSSAMPASPPPPAPLGSTSFDFDGDDKADAARWRSSTGFWEIKYSATNTTASDTLAPGKLAPADYDGDGLTDLASFNNGVWTIRYSGTGQIAQPITGFGQTGDVPVSGNYIGDGAADLALFRPSNGTWYVREVNNVTVTSVQFGQAGDIAVPGNYDGQGYMDYAVFRPLGGVWHILGSNSGYYYSQWGVASDIPVAADFDGDGKSDLAVYRPSSGAWYSLNSNSGGGYIQETWGNYGDQPAPADYDADGKADFSVFRPTSGVWHTKKSNGGTYEFHALGTPQDVSVESAYIKQVGGQVISYDMAKTRLSPKNATGGTDLYSRNFGWSSSLVGLSGRAGLDMGFGISYNSLVWTKHTDPATNDSTMYFDVDNSNISPGFRFGFPTIEPIYYSDNSKDFSYMMVTPSGARVEFKQKNGASDTFETVDSSYVQLKTVGAASPNDPVEAITITVTGTDGTKMTYNWKGGAFRASEIKDRNGNFITIVHDDYGLLQSVTDTLGRIVTVEYDSQLYPTAIKQTWKDDNGEGANITHYWARFEYTTIAVNPQFVYTLGIYGPTGGAPVKVLEKIKRADNSSTVFEYQQNSFGQVSKIRNMAPDGHELNYVQTNLVSPGTNLTDCPRLSQTKTWAENFNGGAEVVFNNDYQENQPTWGGGQGTIITITRPDGVTPTGVVIEKSHMFGTGSGWVEALPFYSETCTSANCGGTDKKRWVVTTWTQDDTNLSYKNNPRVTSSTVSDSVSSRKVENIYSDPNEPLIARYGLTKENRLYDVYQNNKLLKSSVFNYNLTTPYLSKNIVGLPSEVRSYGEQNGTLVLASKMTYGYDEENFSHESNQNISSVIQHDNSAYSASFIVGRGNLTSMTRHDVTGQTASVTSKIRYDIAGSTVAQIDSADRKVRIEYSDVFNDDQNRNTFAYATKLIDPANKFSEIEYRFDMGANVRAKSPDLNANTPGKQSAREYDLIGRLSKETLVNHGGAYTRYEYPANAVQLKVYTTVVDANNNNGADAVDEVLTESWSDGAGRMIRTRSKHPGSAGGWSATHAVYNVLGQVTSSSVPTEVDDNWQLAGDGQTRGWLWNSQEYDWKGRVAKSINTDGSFSQAFYDGCGCAGGEVITVEGEQVAEGRRKQKVYSDVLGRKYKTEILNWDNTVYSTTVVKYNERDQEVWVKQFVGAAPFDALSTDSCPVQANGELQSCQITKMTYDGHGRLKTQHKPQQNADKVTAYDYYQTDEIQKVTDARGATTVYTYNERGLVTNINSAMPPASQNYNGGSSWEVCEPDDEDCCPTCPPENGTSSPVGFLDSVDSSNWKAKGWSFDPDNSSASNTVHFYIDGTAVTGTYIGQATADLPRPDVNNAYNITGNHGFEFTIPNQYLDGSHHTIYAYGIDTGSDDPRLLSGSPKSFAYSTNTTLPPLNMSVAFGYDDAGNRLWMTDNLGRTDYKYDSLSRLKSEIRAFTDTTQNGNPLVMANAPLPNNSFELQYAYGLAGQLKSLTDPYGAVINYGYDEAGRLNNVTGSSFGGVTNYASNAKYQAWGGLKELSYGSTLQMQMTYNNRLQAATYNLAGGTSGQVMNKQYDYYADGSLRYAQDLMNPIFDRLNIYDHVGRIKEGKSGLEARGGTVQPNDQSLNLPYRQSYQFNAFGNLTQRDNLHWGVTSWYSQNNNLNYTYKNNRIQGSGWQYDADGRNTQSAYPDEYASSTYNSAGQMIRSQGERSDISRWYDGNGREIKRITANLVENPNSSNWVLQPVKYYIRSSILGNEVVSEVWANGKKGKTFVRAEGAKIAYQSAHWSDTAQLNEAVFFEYQDASGTSQRTTDKLGAAVATGDGGEGSPVETDPMGSNVGTTTPYIELQPPYEPPQEYPMLLQLFDDAPTYIDGQRVTLTLDGLPISYGRLYSMAQAGAVAMEINHFHNGQIYRFQAPITAMLGSLVIPSSYRFGFRGEVDPEPYIRITGISWINFDSRGQQTQQINNPGPKLGKGVPKNLKDLVLGLANTNKCGEVFEQLIQTSSKKYNEWKKKAQKNGTSIIETIYDSLKRVSIDPNNRTHAGNAGGDVRFKDDYNTDSRGILAVWSRFAAATIQEMIHQVFNDSQLLTASKTLYKNLDSTLKPGVDDMKKANGGKLYEHHILGEACKITDSQLTTPFNINPSSISPFSNPYWNFP